MSCCFSVSYNAWPLPSAGLIPIMQGFCNPSNGVRNEKGFLEYPNSTAKEMLNKIHKLASLNLTTDTISEELFPLDYTQKRSLATDDNKERNSSFLHEVINDLASLASHLPHGLCTSKNPADIIKEADRVKKRRPESLVSESTGQFDDSSKQKLNQRLEKNSGFIGLWLNMQKTFCGVEITPKQQQHDSANSTNSTSSKSGEDEMGSFSALALSKSQLQSVSLIFHVIYSNPVILYSPNTQIIREKLIKKANVIGNSTNSTRDLLEKIDVIDSAACSWLQLMSSINLDVFKGFSNESDLVDYFLNRAYNDNVTVIASLVFDVGGGNGSSSADKLEPFLKYKIRQNASFTYTTKKIRERYWYPSPRDWDYYYYIFGRLIF